MGGTSETRVAGIRMHVSGGEVHAHNDSGSAKFTAKVADFKKSVNDAFEALKKNNGILRIPGKTATDLYIMRDGSDYHLFVAGKSIKTELEKFTRSI